MSYNFRIIKIDRWLDLNEYEGQIRGIIDDKQLSCYLFASPESWSVLSAGQEINISLWIERAGDILVTKDRIIAFEPVSSNDDVAYKVAGQIISVEGEGYISLKTVLPLTVDMDIPYGQSDEFVFDVGCFIEFIGILKMKIESIKIPLELEGY